MNKTETTPYTDFCFYLSRTYEVKIRAPKGIGKRSIEDYVYNNMSEARDKSTPEERERLCFVIKCIWYKNGRITIKDENNGIYTVLLTHLYLIKISTANNNPEEAQRLVELFVGDVEEWRPTEKMRIKSINRITSDILYIDKSNNNQQEGGYKDDNKRRKQQNN